MIPTREEIDAFLLAVMRDRGMQYGHRDMRVLDAVMSRLGEAGFCWHPFRDIADAAGVSLDALERSVRRWSGMGDEPPVLVRMEARSGPRAVRRHVLLYCPRLTGITAPDGLGLLELCDLPDCEPTLTIARGAEIAPRLGSREPEVTR
ncbi:hypothetical protein [Microbacterium sp. 13-71-7]|jgi:hypothetical protein|uniref:hypothetical protein n=1 Tax=Microbacterium sp. 13-71-7 TaxID=1970399 RepID=UPI000BD9DDB6|nr:hypothetical protein [Microbacterium sp. 13-71-7]OZB83833.1 MAG: hypothetical protein B7X32_09060 [Microbacterium sp. 13-71-7]